MSPLFSRGDWRSLMTALAIDVDRDCSLHLAAAELLAAHGESLRAAYIRACCPTSVGNDTHAGSILPQDFHLDVIRGWVPDGELLCCWQRGFVVRVHGPLAALRRELTRLVLREPLYQNPDGPLAVSVSDHSPAQYDESEHERWTWGSHSTEVGQTIFDSAALLPPDLFEVLPWPPMFDSPYAAAVALSAALLSEAHELAERMQSESLHND